MGALHSDSNTEFRVYATVHKNWHANGRLHARVDDSVLIERFRSSCTKLELQIESKMKSTGFRKK